MYPTVAGSHGGECRRRLRGVVPTLLYVCTLTRHEEPPCPFNNRNLNEKLIGHVEPCQLYFHYTCDYTTYVTTTNEQRKKKMRDVACDYWYIADDAEEKTMLDAKPHTGNTK